MRMRSELCWSLPVPRPSHPLAPTSRRLIGSTPYSAPRMNLRRGRRRSAADRDAPASADQSLADILDLPRDDRFSILVRQYNRRAREARKASAEVQSRIHAVLDDVWEGRDLRDGVTLTEPRGANIDRWAHLVLTYGPATSFVLSDERWVEAATCGWLFNEQITWLRTESTQQRFDAAADIAAADPERFSDLLSMARDVDVDVEHVVGTTGRPRVSDLRACPSFPSSRARQYGASVRSVM
jgi:hypothetical protein